MEALRRWETFPPKPPQRFVLLRAVFLKILIFFVVRFTENILVIRR